MKTSRKILFSLVAFALTALAGELFCRAFGFGQAAPADGTISNWHETPDGGLFWVARGPEFNADGLRDREHEVSKPDGVQRIVCLGDSVTMGFKVKRSETYTYMLEEFMRQLGLTVEVFNVAQSGWSTRQELEAYRRLVRKYQPDHVILGFCLNDVAEMNNNLLRRPTWFMRNVASRSALLRAAVGAERAQIRRVEELFRDPPSAFVRDGWNSVLTDLAVLRDTVTADGCGLSVLIFPFRFQVLPNAPDPVAQRTMSAFCLQQGIPSLDLLPALARVGPDAFVDDSHLSPLGARVVAEEIIRWGQTGCMMCGHDLAGLDAPVCPRCGTAIDRLPQ